ncbi:MAG: hypothetical protein QXJ68_06415 [Methanocellales archaeon]
MQRGYVKQCKSPVDLLPSDILNLANFFGMKPLKIISTFCKLVNIDDYFERIRDMGIKIPELSNNLKIYAIQIKARRYCIFYKGENCVLPLAARPKRCMAKTEQELRAYEAEKHAFYLELAEYILNAGDVERGIELYFQCQASDSKKP